MGWMDPGDGMTRVHTSSGVCIVCADARSVQGTFATTHPGISHLLSCTPLCSRQFSTSTTLPFVRRAQSVLALVRQGLLTNSHPSCARFISLPVQDWMKMDWCVR